MMQILNTSCCAVQDIDHLATHTTAREAMVVFCQLSLSQQLKFKAYTPMKDTLYAFYIFTAAVEREGSDTKRYKPYGNNFADFIKENSLGDLWESPRSKNNAFHPDHENIMWVWQPDIKKLRAWWSLQPENPAVVKTKMKDEAATRLVASLAAQKAEEATAALAASEARIVPEILPKRKQVVRRTRSKVVPAYVNYGVDNENASLLQHYDFERPDFLPLENE